MKSLFSVVIPIYGNEKNLPITVPYIIEHLELFENYRVEVIMVNDGSPDNSWEVMKKYQSEYPDLIKIASLSRNFGQMACIHAGMDLAKGDVIGVISADMQEPFELFADMLKEWEKGYKIVCAVKTSSKENPVMYFLRSCYYKMIKKMSSVDQIEHFTGFGLYDKSFVQVLRDLKDPIPFIRGIVGELGFKRTEIEYTQAQRRAGKTHNNFYTLYDAAMLSFTSYTKIGLRIATFLGAACAGLSVIVAIIYFILKLIYWNRFQAGMVPLIILVSLTSSLQLFFIGLLGEYILSMNKRLMNRPLVVEEERLNFKPEKPEQE